MCDIKVQHFDAWLSVNPDSNRPQFCDTSFPLHLFISYLQISSAIYGQTGTKLGISSAVSWQNWTIPGYYLAEWPVCALGQVDACTWTSDWWAPKISKMYQISDFHEWHLHKCHTSALSQVISLTVDYIISWTYESQRGNPIGSELVMLILQAQCKPWLKQHFNLKNVGHFL